VHNGQPKLNLRYKKKALKNSKLCPQNTTLLFLNVEGYLNAVDFLTVPVTMFVWNSSLFCIYQAV